MTSASRGVSSPTPKSSDDFGRGVALEGDRLAIGARGDDQAGLDRGAVFVFHRDDRGTPHDVSDDAWVLEDTLLPTLFGSSWFGHSLSLDGDNLLVGRPSSTSAHSIAYVYRRDDGGTPGDPGDDDWLLQDELPAPSSDLGDDFGWDVALSGDWALIGDPHDDTAANQAGAASLFRRDDAGTPADPADDTWVLHTKLFGSHPGPFYRFGYTVDLQRERALIGARGEATSAGADAGAVYVFEREKQGTADPSDDTWHERARLTAADGFPGDAFGGSVDLEGELALIGAPGDDDLGDISGAVYLFRHDDAGTPGAPGDDAWLQLDKLHAPDGGEDDLFGETVLLKGDTVVVGSEHPAGPGFVRKGYVFRLEDDLSFTAAGEVHAVAFSTSPLQLACDGATLLVGSAGDSALASGAGAAHVFAIEQAPWTWLGQSLAGAAGTPCLFGAGPLTTGSLYTISVHDGAPASVATMILGGTPLNAPFKGGVLVPSPDRLYAVSLDVQGGFSATAPWPAGIPALTELFLQAWIVDATAPAGFSATNALSFAGP
ncbi:MAG TPA: hypothetical protein VFD43_01090 [Planctomycetota bacterium]|nr:hypothetical protein [Planctomycetota bacterium]